MHGSQTWALVFRERGPFRVWVCVLLAFLILYNPFTANMRSGDASAVRGLARHRATVGASELQHFTGSPDQTQQTDVNLQENHEGFASFIAEYQPQSIERDVEVPQPDSISRVWSRPPPSL
jgi:hypothetical protein